MKIETEYKGVKLPARMLVYNIEDSIKKKRWVLVRCPEKVRSLVCYDESYEYAEPIPEKKMRLMTAQELVGKWLVHDNDGIHFVSGLSKDDLITPTFGPSTSSVEMFHILLWKWNDKPSLEGAKSLVVEE